MNLNPSPLCQSKFELINDFRHKKMQALSRRLPLKNDEKNPEI